MVHHHYVLIQSPRTSLIGHMIRNFLIQQQTALFFFLPHSQLLLRPPPQTHPVAIFRLIVAQDSPRFRTEELENLVFSVEHNAVIYLTSLHNLDRAWKEKLLSYHSCT